MIKVESTLTLSRFDTYERLDKKVNEFIQNHKIISVTPFTHGKCNKPLCNGDIGYQIIYDDEQKI